MIKSKVLGGLSTVLLLSACAGWPVVQPATIDHYTPQYAAGFGAAGQLELIGSAFGPVGTERLAEVAALGVSQGSMAGPQFLLQPRGPEDPLSKSRVVVVIGGGAGASLCSSPPVDGGRLEGPGTLHVAAAACYDDYRLSSTSGSVSDVTGPDDPAVARLFRQIGAALFPRRNPNYEDNDRDRGADWRS